MPTLAVLTLVSMYREDIRGAVSGVGVMLDDRLFDFLLAAGLFGLVVVLVLKSDRATRTCEDLREQVKRDLAAHQNKLGEDLANHRSQLQQDLVALVDERLEPITDGLTGLQSHAIALGGRLDALDSRITALGGRLDALDSRITALKDLVTRPTNTN